MISSVARGGGGANGGIAPPPIGLKSRVSNRTVNPNEPFHFGEPEPAKFYFSEPEPNLNPQNCAQVNPNRT